MSSLEVIAVPVFGKSEGAWLTRLRAAKAGSIGPPHFTLVFPGSELTPVDFASEIRHRAAGIKRIAFHLRSAMVVPDPQVRSYHVFLMPDEGFGAMVRLHDHLYAGKLAPLQSRTIAYLPHLTAASLPDIDEARRLAAKLNAGGIAIAGRIDALEIHRRDGETVRCVATVPLVKPRLFG
jgi:2'-5' RNA ligase